MTRYFVSMMAVAACVAAGFAQTPFEVHGRLRVAANKTHLEHADGTPYFVLADTCWTGPALSTEADWKAYLADRKKKGFTAIQFNIASPWRTAPTDADGNVSCKVVGDDIEINEAFYKRLDSRFRAINEAGMLAMPVLVWALKKEDLGMVLTAKQATKLCDYELARYKDAHALWILAGDNPYNAAESQKWKSVGRTVFAKHQGLLVTTHPTGQNFPWASWADESWLNVIGYQSGHGDGDATWKWLHSGPPANTAKHPPGRPVMNLEPPYEGHNGYQSKKPHSDFSVRRATYWSLLVHTPMGVTYGGHGVWSWHTKPGEHPTGHQGSGPAKLWKEALDLPGATQMGYARKFFEAAGFATLRPANDLLAEQPGTTKPAEFVSVGANADRSTIVAYTPTGTLSFKPGTIKPGAKVTWFDARTGESKPGDATFKAPAHGDWAMTVKQ